MTEVHAKQCISSWLIGQYDVIRRSWMSHTIHQHSLEHPDSIPPWIPFDLFASHGNYSPLSTPVLWSTIYCVAGELFRKYCLFGNTWFNFLSGTCHGLCCYLDCLQLKGSSFIMILCTNIHNKYSKYSTIDLGWVTETYLYTLTLHLSSTDSWTIPRWYLCFTWIGMLVSIATNSPHELELSNKENMWVGKTLTYRMKFWL